MMTTTIDFKGYEQRIKAAGETLAEERIAVNELRAEHAAALGRLEALRGELAAVDGIIREYGDSDETEITPKQFEEALIQQRVLAPQLRRAQAEQKRASAAWQDADRQTTHHAQARRRGILADFDREANRVRDEYGAILQKQL